MVIERKITKKYYFMTFVITFLIFSVSFLFGWYINNQNYMESSNQLNEIKTGLLRYDLQYKLLGAYPCEFILESSPIENEFEEIRSRIVTLEREKGTSNLQVLDLKKYYSLLELSDLVYYEEINKKCGSDYNIIFYFYSNDDNKCPSCEKQGFVLDYVYNNNEGIKIYSFDYDLDLVELDILKKKYSIDSVPSIVIDGKLLNGFSEKEEIESLL
jgi:hypothetical protein